MRGGIWGQENLACWGKLLNEAKRKMASAVDAKEVGVENPAEETFHYRSYHHYP
jgi:hypothetical protein